MLTINEFDKTHYSSSQNIDTHTELIPLLDTIKTAIQERKDEAVIEYTQKFDSIHSENFSLRVSEEEIQNAYKQVSPEFIESIQLAIKNVRQFHENQLPIDWEESLEEGYSYGMQYTAIESAGLYVPGGKALYPSSVIMNAIPAKTAGVKTCVMTTPPLQDGSIAPEVLVTAKECDIEIIIKAGGAQAIFGLAFGTESIPKVDKIVGPGNKYVDKAKQMVYGVVDIDKPAGPSEVLIYIEDSTYIPFAAAELLAQCEHDPDASGIILSPQKNILTSINDEITTQLSSLKRKDIITEALKNSALFTVENRKKAIEAIDTIATEHLVLMIDDAESVKREIKHAGAIFCGAYTPVACGDYISGPNHVLPTGRSARFSSPLSVMDFVKFSSHLTYTKEGLEKIAPHIERLTQVEKLDAHYNTIQKRLN
ncbi:histidinol dehydrogenase [Candidatus Marinamargulisbacteria bacterium SCGC AG-343-D04]|nr:histidinol dehydrogenase [Candidatus Marinamargulisbacteria bacterium SCGC AG-343-D04]